MNLSTEHTDKFRSSETELNSFREWFEAVQDLNPEYLNRWDYFAAERLYVELGMRVPISILKGKNKDMCTPQGDPR